MDKILILKENNIKEAVVILRILVFREGHKFNYLYNHLLFLKYLFFYLS